MELIIALTILALATLCEISLGLLIEWSIHIYVEDFDDISG
jgi:hypothetical protein